MMLLLWVVEWLSSIFELSMYSKFANKFMMKRERYAQTSYLEYLVLFIFSILSVLMNTVALYSPVNISLVIIMLIIAGMILFKASNFVRLAIAVSYVAILFAVDFSVITIYGMVSGRDANLIIDAQSTARLACIIVSKLLLYVIVSLFHESVIKKSYAVILGLVCSFVLMVFVGLIDLISDFDVPSEILFFTTIFFVAIIALIVSVFLSIYHVSKKFEKEAQYNRIQYEFMLLEEKRKKNEELFAQWKQSIHNYKNDILCLEQLAAKDSNGNSSKLMEYIQQLKDAAITKTTYLQTGNNIADAIINNKMQLANDAGISISNNVMFPPNFQISSTNLCAILANTLDNALEASVKNKGKCISLIIRPVKSFVFIKITNACDEDPSGVIQEKMSTKSAPFHGIGISTVENIVEEQSGTISYQYDMDKKQFSVIIMLPLDATVNQNK